MTIRILRIVILSVVFIAFAAIVFSQQPPKAHLRLSLRAPQNCRVGQVGGDYQHTVVTRTPWESCRKAHKQIKRKLKRGIYAWLERRDPHFVGKNP
jgi:hypothetical protein